MAPAFKVGDEIRLVKAPWNSIPVELFGTTARITHIDTPAYDEIPYQLTWPDGATYYAGAEHLAPAPAAVRKSMPLCTGCLDIWPDALAEIAGSMAKLGLQHGHSIDDIHWERGKSGDHPDALMRHLRDRGTSDTDGVKHSVKVAIRALELLQEELEAERGLALPRGARGAK